MFDLPTGEAWERSLALELRTRGHRVLREVPTKVFYKGTHVATYKTDLVVDDRVVLEIKSTKVLNR